MCKNEWQNELSCKTSICLFSVLPGFSMVFSPFMNLIVASCTPGTSSAPSNLTIYLYHK